MSVWTHVAGCIRIDNDEQIDFKKIFIKHLWNEKDEGECNMPMGSEGSLDYRIIDENNVYIFGDLRGYDSEQEEEIRQWWDSVLRQINYVRQAVLQVFFEDRKEPLILSRCIWCDDE